MFSDDTTKLLRDLGYYSAPFRKSFVTVKLNSAPFQNLTNATPPQPWWA